MNILHLSHNIPCFPIFYIHPFFSASYSSQLPKLTQPNFLTTIFFSLIYTPISFFLYFTRCSSYLTNSLYLSSISSSFQFLRQSFLSCLFSSSFFPITPLRHSFNDFLFLFFSSSFCCVSFVLIIHLFASCVCSFLSSVSSFF